MHQSSTLDVGMAVHQESLAVADVANEPDAAVISLGTFGTRPCDLDTLIRQLPSQATHLVVVSEAGPCGSWLDRDLTTQDSVGGVVAPSVIPHKAGDRVKPDRRDARPLARLRRSGDLTPVSVPARDDEALRDLSRARAEPRRDLQAATRRLNACVLRHASRSTGRAPGRPAHRRWRSAVGCPTPAQQSIFQAYVQTVTDQPERLGRLGLALPEQGNTWRFAPVVEALQALRGVPLTVAVTSVAARGDRTRVENPRPLLHDLGLTPAAYARGGRRQQGGMTQTGPTPARRALVEGAWADRYPANVSRHLQLRLETRPTAIHAISWQAQVRLGKRDRQLLANGTHAKQVVVAMARAFSACMWAMAKQVAGSPNASSGRGVDAHVPGFPP